MPSTDTPAFAGIAPGVLARIVAEVISRAAAEPVPLETWRGAVEGHYATAARSTRCRVTQAVREAVALAGPGATTADLTPALVARWAASPAMRGRRKATADGLLAGLRAACGLPACKAWFSPGQLDGASWAVRRPEETPRRKWHRAEEIGRVLAHLAAADSWEGRRLHAFAAVLAYTGLRKNEALRLKVADLDLGRGYLTVRPNGGRLKTGASAATVPMPDALVAILRGWVGRCGSEWLFPGVRRRGPWTGGAAGRRAGDRLRAAGEAVGVRGLTPHTLRHSLATALAGRGLADRQVRQVLRHAPGTRAIEGYVGRDLVELRRRVRDLDFGRPGDRPRPARKLGRRIVRIDPGHGSPSPSHRRPSMLQFATPARPR